jgi:hypothetical protein
MVDSQIQSHVSDTLAQEQQDIAAVTNNLPPKFPYYRINTETGEPEEITRAEYKKAMRETFTVKHKVIPACNHKFVPGHEPQHRNCEHCWFVFFQTHGELTQSVEELFQKHGKQPVIALKGVKFFDNWLKFMSTVAAFKAAVETAKEKNGSTGSIEGSNEIKSYGDDEGAEYTTYAEQEAAGSD